MQFPDDATDEIRSDHLGVQRCNKRDSHCEMWGELMNHHLIFVPTGIRYRSPLAPLHRSTVHTYKRQSRTRARTHKPTCVSSSHRRTMALALKLYLSGLARHPISENRIFALLASASRPSHTCSPTPLAPLSTRHTRPGPERTPPPLGHHSPLR